MKKAFVISPIGEPGSASRVDADNVLEQIIRPAASAHGYCAYRGDHVSAPGMIVSQICDSIIADPLIIAYLSAGNPNVYYELAIAHTLRKPLVLLRAPTESIPFDIGGARAVTVDFQNIEHCIGEVSNQITFLDDATTTIRNPLNITPEAVLNCQLPRVTKTSLLPFDVSGRWTGYTIESFPPGSDGPYKNYHAEMRLETRGQYCTGSIFIAYGDDLDSPPQNSGILKVHGMLRCPRFARLNYDNDRIESHCGVLFIEFNDNGLDAIGTFGGCGIASKQPVHGKVTLRKAD